MLIFAQHKTENVQRNHVKFCWYILWNLLFPIMCFFTPLSAFYQRSYVVGIKFSTVCMGVRICFYAKCWYVVGIKFSTVCMGVRICFYAKCSYKHSICVELIFFTGDVINSGLHANFFTFSIRGAPDS